MDLILWRHAEAEDARAGEGDLARALTARGERQARRMAQWLAGRLDADTRVLASPARRTRETASALGRDVEVVQVLAPDASVDAVLQAAAWPASPVPVLVVGHQPTLGQVAARLLADQPHPWSVRKGAVWWLRGRERDGALQVVLHAVQAPDDV